VADDGVCHVLSMVGVIADWQFTDFIIFMLVLRNCDSSR
jgi:hypothetical protein